MALVRCPKHENPRGKKHTYVMSVPPVGYPNTAAICGLRGCEEVGLIWLDDAESQAYHKGQRVFGLFTYSAKVRAQ